MALHTSDLQRGVDLALELPSRGAKRDCGAILEQLKQYADAGRVYESGQFWDRSVAAFLKAKNLCAEQKIIKY
jgi:WD repeat-containing protein 19